MKKRILSLLLCLCMVLLMAPAAMATEGPASFANDTAAIEQEYIVRIGDEGSGQYFKTLSAAVKTVSTETTSIATTITFIQNSSGGGVQVEANQKIVFDLNKKTYTVGEPTVGSPGTETNGFQLLKGSTVTFRDGTVKASTYPNLKLLIQNYCDLTLEDVTLDAREAPQCQYVSSNNFGTTTIKGNTNILAADGQRAFDLWYGMSNDYSAGVTVTFDEDFTGTVKGKIEYGRDNNASSSTDWQDITKLEISGAGEFDVSFTSSSSVAGDIIADANIKISSGTFTKPILPKFCANGNAPLVNEDGSCVVMPTSELDNKKYSKNEDGTYYVSDEAAAADNEAKIGTTCYATLEEAVEAAGTNGVGTTIELLKNVVLDATGKPDTQGALTINKDLTINGNSHKISGTDFTAEGNEPGASLINIGTDKVNVTLNNVKLDGGATDTNTAGAKHGLNINSTDGTVTLNNNVEIMNCRWYAVMNNGANLIVNGLKTHDNQWGVNIDKGGSGTFNNANIEESASIVYETKDKDSSLTVKGGTYVNVEIKEGAQGNVSLTDGTFSGDITGNASKEDKQAIVKISGGTYPNANVREYLVDGLVQNTDGSVGKPYTPPANPSYSITTPAAENGKVTVSPTSAKAGTKVTITVTPDDGFELDELTVTRGSTAVTVTKNSDGTYSFTMPRGSVTVTATFVCDGGDKCPSDPFADVNTNLWYHEEIDYVVENGLMNGDSPTTFAPQRELSRAELAQILYNKEGRPAVEGDMVFADVPAGEWFYPAILWANQEEVVGGDSPTTFVPNRAITREELAVMLYRYAGKPAASGSLKDFTDGDEVSTWAEDAMVWAVTEGIISGDTPTTLDPGDGATRAEAAAMLMRFCENVEQ